MTWTYRLTVHGRFSVLNEEQRRPLRAAQGDHDMFAARFTPEGTFLYTPELVNYQHRFLITVDEADPSDAEVFARFHGEELSAADLEHRSLAGRVVDITAVCVEDVKVGRGSQRQTGAQP